MLTCCKRLTLGSVKWTYKIKLTNQRLLLQIVVIIRMRYLHRRLERGPAPGANLRQVHLAKSALANHHLAMDLVGADNGQPVWQAMVDRLHSTKETLSKLRIERIFGPYVGINE